MQRHPILKDDELPNCLKKPLEWGNREQIDALHGLEQKIQEKEDEASGVLKTYRVFVEVNGYMERDVMAKSEKEAKEIAQDDWDIDEIDMDVTYGIVAR